MFDIGFWEMLIVGVVALIVVGPKDLPRMFRTVGNYMGKARHMARQFQRTMDDAAREADLQEVRDAASMVQKAADPLKSATNAAQDYAKSFADDVAKSATPTDAPANTTEPAVQTPSKPGASADGAQS
ncbi:MAG: Sec-independent protein translocase protein TatB [Pseudomonadota bacterium]